MSRRPARLVEPPSAYPWRAVVLAVDTAGRSGWAVRAGSVLLAYGEADTLDALSLDRVVTYALESARYPHHALGGRAEPPTVLVLERPWGARRNAVATLMALGAARERWLQAWHAHGQSPRRVVSVRPHEWRRPVLGRACVGMVREDVQALEQAYAREHTGDHTVRCEESAAIGISVWAERAAEVGKVLGARVRAASGGK